MKFHEWVKWFEDKTGEKFYLLPYFNIEFNEDKGFMCWKKDGDTFLLEQCASKDHNYWKEWILNNAKGCKRIRTFTRRNVKAFCRCTGTKVIEERIDTVTGETVYLVEREVD